MADDSIRQQATDALAKRIVSGVLKPKTPGFPILSITIS